MAFRRDRHPDMNLNEIDYSVTYQICQIFDIDRSWEQLAGVIGYSTSQIQIFELDTRRADGSPTKKLLWDWGTRGATARDLYNKLNLINKTQTMKLLEPIMKADEQKEREKQAMSLAKEENSSLLSKDDNLSVSSSPSMASSGAGALPIPTKKNKNKNGPRQSSYSNENVNLNRTDGKPSKPSEKDKQKLLGIPGVGTSSIKIQECHADGPASGPGNLGAAASSARSFERVKSVVEEYDTTSTLYMSQLSTSEQEMARALITIPHYTYKELSQATEGFSPRYVIGEGKFGKMYRGRVRNTEYAIKKLYPNPNLSLDSDSTVHLAAELRSLSRYRHENIVSLHAYALDGDEICLVYQFMHNGSLEDCLHKSGGKLVLKWEQRLVILKGSACGLQFLHSVDPKPVVHGDIKSSNILLDRHFEPKIGDLGMAQQATGGDVTGKYTHITKKNTGVQDFKNRAYHAPEMTRGGGASLKGDTFAFGVVMLECLTGTPAFDSRREGSADEKNLVIFINNHLFDNPKCNKHKTFQDPKLEQAYPEAVFTTVFGTAERCLQEKKKDRPSMVEVYKILETIEGTHSDAEYYNLKGTVKATDLPKVQELQLKKQTSNEENTPGIWEHPPLTGNQPISPVDYLPADQLPESVKLQMEVDKRIEMAKSPDYVNVSKLRDVQEIFKSDPKKLAEIQKCDRDFNGGSMKGVDKTPDRSLKGKEIFEAKQELFYANKCQLGAFEANPEKKLTADEKVEKLETFAENSQIAESESHDYVNVPVLIDDQTKLEVAQGGPMELSHDLVHDFDAELEEIREKAVKPNSTMMDIFKKFDDAKDDYEFDEADFAAQYEGYIDFQFDFEKEDSDSSTLKLSQSDDGEKLDSFHLSDVKDDDLFGSDRIEAKIAITEQIENAINGTSQINLGDNVVNGTGQMNLGERDPGENEEAYSLEMDTGDKVDEQDENLDLSLQKHRMKQAQYCGILNDIGNKREGDIMVDKLIAKKDNVLAKKDNVSRQPIEIGSEVKVSDPEVKGPPGEYPGLKMSPVDKVKGPRVASESEYVYV